MYWKCGKPGVSDKLPILNNLNDIEINLETHLVLGKK